MMYEGLKVKLVDENSCGDIIERKMEVIDVDHSKSSSKLTINMVQLISWPKQGLPHPSAITSLIERLTNILRRCNSKQTVVMCRLESINIKYIELVFVICVYLYNSDGVVRSGTFVCIHSQLERLKTEGVVDVFQAIKSARIHRPGIISNTVSYSKYIICSLLDCNIFFISRITMYFVMKYWLGMLRRWKCMQTLKLSYSNL